MADMAVDGPDKTCFNIFTRSLLVTCGIELDGCSVPAAELGVGLFSRILVTISYIMIWTFFATVFANSFGTDQQSMSGLMAVSVFIRCPSRLRVIYRKNCI